MDIKYKAVLYHNQHKNRGLIYKNKPDNIGLYGLAAYSNEMLVRFKQCEIQTLNGWQSLSDDLLETNESNLKQLKSEVDVDTSEPIKVRTFLYDVVNKLDLVYFSSIQPTNKYLPVWLSILLHNKRSYGHDDFKITCGWDRNKKKRYLWVNPITDDSDKSDANESGDSSDLQAQIESYRADQSDLEPERLWKQKAQKFGMTEDEKKALRRYHDLLNKMGREPEKEKMITTFQSWGISPSRAKMIYEKEIEDR